MSEQPRPGDRVRVTFEGRWTGHSDEIEQDNGRVIAVDTDIETVEIVEPADDPSADPIGAVRRGVAPMEVWIKVNHDRWAYAGTTSSTAQYGDEYIRQTDYRSDVIGAVPGTPAAEANPVPPQVLVRVREMLANGQKVRAIKAVREASVGLGLKEAKAYVESLPECAVGERMREDQIRDGLNLNPHGWEPRVFQADGPEPPEDVKVLRWLDSNPENRWPYLVHGRSGWTWATGPDDLPSHLGAYWNDATRASPGRYEEVQP